MVVSGRPLKLSLLGGRAKGLVDLHLHLREHTFDRHHTVDDTRMAVIAGVIDEGGAVGLGDECLPPPR